MPRPNPKRSIASEQALARRVAFEREHRGMSYDGLASRMTQAGCPIQASGLYKIEKAGRRITVDELVAFAQVFGVPVEQLLVPPELVAAEELVDLVVSWDRAQDEATAANRALTDAWERLQTWVVEHTEHADKVEEVIRFWSQNYFEDDHDFRVARIMYGLTGGDEWAARVSLAAADEQE